MVTEKNGVKQIIVSEELHRLVSIESATEVVTIRAWIERLIRAELTKRKIKFPEE